MSSVLVKGFGVDSAILVKGFGRLGEVLGGLIVKVVYVFSLITRFLNLKSQPPS